jgi:LytTr DNA-binding domain-containing protein
MQKTFNDLIADLKGPIPLLSWILGTFICTVTGPFGTYEISTLGFRFLFWGGILLIALVFSLLCVHATHNLRPLWGHRKISAVAGTIFTITYSTFIILLIQQIYPPEKLPSPLMIVVIVAGVTFSIQILIHLTGGRKDTWGTTTAPLSKQTPKPELKLGNRTNNPFLSRIDANMGTKLVRLTMRDHYVETYTCRGMQLIHMRFSDAVNALSHFNGLQPHRSHWINLDEMCELIKKDGKFFFRMSDGFEVPIARGKLKQVKQLGLLP